MSVCACVWEREIGARAARKNIATDGFDFEVQPRFASVSSLFDRSAFESVSTNRSKEAPRIYTAKLTTD